YRLAQPLAPLLGTGPGDPARRHLVERLPGADAEDDASGEHRPQRAKDLGDDRRVIAEGRGQDAGADNRAPCARAKRAQPGERIGRMTVSVFPRLEMVADKDRIKTDLFGKAGKI